MKAMVSFFGVFKSNRNKFPSVAFQDSNLIIRSFKINLKQTAAFHLQDCCIAVVLVSVEVMKASGDN